MTTWRALHGLLAKLPVALGAQLQNESDLSFLEYYVLAGLSERPDHSIRISDLAAISYSELSRMSHLIKRLEARGLVRRQPDPTDRRFTKASLTEAGHSLLVQAAPGHVETVRQLVFDVLDKTSQHALRDAARRITDHLDGSC